MAAPRISTFRQVVRIEMIENFSALRKGQVLEVHPVMATRLMAKDVAKKTTKPMGMATPVSKIV